MYSLPYFKESDQNTILQFMRDNPFVVLCGTDRNGLPIATQVPVFVDEKEGKIILSGHMMKNTDHHLAFTENNDALALFMGAHCYVSASWYTEPKTASTWNYMSVHARGKMIFLDEAALLSVLKRTTDHFENNVNSAAGFDQLPMDYVMKLSKAIVAFDIEVEDIQNVFKLSQNRDEKSCRNIIDKLEDMPDAGSRTIAAEMKKRLQ
jgi:transcriptional regulator